MSYNRPAIGPKTYGFEVMLFCAQSDLPMDLLVAR